ncbi:MAG: 2-oxoacid:ferredoxin oxidoreductase subunit beta [Mucispirillum sp.]|nr:2-oxoacid:ferredoxin oxidoreductase subunit beta [Mucispirillum sp.]
MAFDYEKYIRKGRLPHIWCPGCGYGIIMKAMIRAIDTLGWNRDETVVASGIGCASRLPGYIDFNTVHTTHGRCLAFAAGIKMANPALKVIAMGGDGDMCAIGGNHFIHACRRNMDMTVFVFNNHIYGMTGGNYSPTTPMGAKASTAPYGMAEPNFDICALAIAAGASFVGRTSSYHAVPMEKLMLEALNHKGFSVVEIVSGCPTGYGRKNNLKTPADMLLWQKDNAVNAKAAEKMTDEELKGKFIIGTLYKSENKPEFIENYDRITGVRKGRETI